VHSEVPNKVGVLVDYLELLACIIVVHTNLSIICSYYNPLLTRHKPCASNWSIGDLE
jgi:hypothetical protein